MAVRGVLCMAVECYVWRRSALAWWPTFQQPFENRYLFLSRLASYADVNMRFYASCPNLRLLQNSLTFLKNSFLYHELTYILTPQNSEVESTYSKENVMFTRNFFIFIL